MTRTRKAFSLAVAFGACVAAHGQVPIPRMGSYVWEKVAVVAQGQGQNKTQTSTMTRQVRSGMTKMSPMMTAIKVAVRAVPIDAKVYSVNGRMLIPASAFKAMQTEIIQNDENAWEMRSQTGQPGVITGTLQIYFGKDPRILVNGTKVDPDIWPTMIDGELYVPARLAADALRLNVFYDRYLRTVFLRER